MKKQNLGALSTIVAAIKIIKVWNYSLPKSDSVSQNIFFQRVKKKM